MAELTEADYFARIDAEPINTILIFDDIALANRYVAHRAKHGDVGLVCRIEDTRTRSGLLTQWRDPVPAADFARRQREALWLLEEVIAGRVPRPVRGEINNVTADTETQRRRQRDENAGI